MQRDKMLKLKVAQSFPKVAQKLATAVFTWNGMFPKSLKSQHTFGIILKETLTQGIFKNHPILSHCRNVQNKNTSFQMKR